MDATEAETLLQDAEIVPFAQAAMMEAKRIRDELLDSGIPAALGRDASCATGGCSPRVQVLVRSEDLHTASSLLKRRWVDSVLQEGMLVLDHGDAPPEAETESDELPCPACGCTSDLVDGACTECGLQLE